MNNKNKTYKIKTSEGTTTYTKSGATTFYKHADLTGEIENDAFNDASYGTSQ